MVKWGAEAQRQTGRLLAFGTIRIKKKRKKERCVRSFNLDATRLNGISSFQPRGSINYLLTMRRNTAAFPELLLQTSHHSESPQAFVILSYQFSDLSRLNVIFICTSFPELIKVSFGYIINEVIWMHLFDRTTLFYFFTVWLKDEVHIV